MLRISRETMESRRLSPSHEMSSEKDPEGMWPQLVGPPNGSQVGAHNSNFTMVYDTQIAIVNED